jgi:hypothetical protein
MCLTAFAPAVRAQDCSSWNNLRLTGTYTMSGNGSGDLSRIAPGLGFPSGNTPMYWVGAFTFDGAGGGGGWVSLNVAGSQMKVQLTDFKYSMQTDCSVQWTFSMKQKELGITLGPIQRLMVVVQKADALELHMITSGSGFGQPPAPAFDLGVAYRVSVLY